MSGRTRAPAGFPPNRLTKDGGRAMRWTGSGKNVSRVIGKDPSHYSRELSGERPSLLGEFEGIVRRLARDSHTDPTPLLVHLDGAVEEEFGIRELDLVALVVEETTRQGAADLAVLNLLDGEVTPEEREAAIEAAERHEISLRRLRITLKAGRTR